MTLIDEFRKIVEDYLENTEFTSASPGFTNRAKQIIYSYEPDEENLVLPFQDPQDPEGQGALPTSSGSSFGLGSGKKIVGGISDPTNIISEFFPIAKLIPVIGLVLGAPAMLVILKKLMTAPGMPFDPRFKRDLQGEAVASWDRDDKALIRQGKLIIRITSSKTQRGELGVGQTGLVGLTGITRYDQEFEAFKKGVVN